MFELRRFEVRLYSALFRHNDTESIRDEMRIWYESAVRSGNFNGELH